MKINKLERAIEDIREHASAGMDFRSPSTAVSSPSPSPGDGGHGGDGGDGAGDADADADADGVVEEEERADAAVVRHRFDKPRRDGSDRNARRIVTLRDRRRGRPPSTHHGNDPPA